MIYKQKLLVVTRLEPVTFGFMSLNFYFEYGVWLLKLSYHH
jgi:hypothetical protein